MDAASSHKTGANDEIALDRPNTITGEKSQRMPAHMCGWGTNKELHCKKG